MVLLYKQFDAHIGFVSSEAVNLRASRQRVEVKLVILTSDQ